MAEINLGINHYEIDTDRVRSGISILQAQLDSGIFHPGGLHYSIGNGFLALEEYDEATQHYQQALSFLDIDHSGSRDMAAECSKNFGTALEKMGRFDAALSFFERAVELDPDLGEAHLALATWHIRFGNNPERALAHLDHVARRKGSAIQMSTVRAWRVELLFRTGEYTAAYREINSLLSDADQFEWVWPWCARTVSLLGRDNPKGALNAVAFWRRYLREHPADQQALFELFLCHYLLKAEGEESDWGFERFLRAGEQLVEAGHPGEAFVWDRIGHWAQYDGNWEKAAKYYRKAYDLEPNNYGYCLGTALNFLERFHESLPILQAEAEVFQPDEMSWFQVAVARSGLGDLEGAIEGYRHAIDIDPEYESAWFNLGGTYWNAGLRGRAVATWREAIERFSNPPLNQICYLLDIDPQHCSSKVELMNKLEEYAIEANRA